MKKLTGKEIIVEILKRLEVKAPTFSANIGVEYAKIYDIQREKTKKISSTVANAIITTYPQFNINWLLTGEGEMLKDSQPARPEEGAPSNNNILVQHLLSQLEKLEQENKKLTEENKKLIADNGYYKGLLDNNKINYSSKVS